MIGIGKSISHTKVSIEYGWNQEKDAKIVFRNHLIGDNPTEITEEFLNIQSLNAQCKRKTLSFVLSPTIEDGKKLSLNGFQNITKTFINELHLTDHQAIAFIHQDKDHKHIHLYVNRIDFSGCAYNDSFISKKAQKTAEIVAKKLNLKTVKQVQEEKLDKVKSLRLAIKLKSDHCIKVLKPTSFQEYIVQMSKQGVNVSPTINQSGQLQGFTFSSSGQNFKGSEVHRELSINKLITKIPFNEIENRKLLQNEGIIINNQSLKLHENVLKQFKEFDPKPKHSFKQSL